MVTIKFYMERGPRGWQPLAVEVDASTGKPIKKVYSFSTTPMFEVLVMMRHAMGGLYASVQCFERVSSGWVRITEHQAREIDKNLHYGSQERITGLFFGDFSHKVDRTYGYQNWKEYLDKGMDPKQLKIRANALVDGYRVRVQAYGDTFESLRYKTVTGTVTSLRVWSDEAVTFRLQELAGTPIRLYGPKEFITVLPVEVKEEVVYGHQDVVRTWLAHENRR